MKDNQFLSVEDLVVEYTSNDQVIHAVNRVSFRLDKGQTLGLVGETGAGKTTIAKSIIGILPDPPAKVRGGRILLEGEDLLQLDDRHMQKIRGKKISMVFQDPMTALNPNMKVGHQIQEVVELHENVSRKEAEEHAKRMLEMVGIPRDRFYEYPHQFSGGMKQRVIIAMALACKPDLLLADEPTTALDVTIQAQVLELIKNLKVEQQTSMILITHDLGVVAGLCDYVGVVYAGEIIEYGTLEDIFDHPTHPYTIGLFGALPSMGKRVKRLSPIHGLPPDPSKLPEGCSFSPRCPRATEACKKAPVEMRNLGGTHECRCILADKPGDR